MLYSETSLSIYLYDMCRYVHNVCASVYPQMYSLGLFQQDKKHKAWQPGFFCWAPKWFDLPTFLCGTVDGKTHDFWGIPMFVHFCDGFWYILIDVIDSYIYIYYTPPKTNIEPENHPVEKENHLPNLHFLGSMLVFRGVVMMSIYILNIYTPEFNSSPLKRDQFEEESIVTFQASFLEGPTVKLRVRTSIFNIHVYIYI